MIKTERLELVDFDRKYANDLFKLWNDFEVIQYTYTPQMFSIHECHQYIDFRLSRANKDFKDTFVILLHEKAIGMIGCPIMDKENAVFGLYYQLSRVNWNRGYATEAVFAIKKYILEKYPHAVIKAEAVSINPASAAVLRKVGFKQTGIQEKGFKRNGFELDLIEFANG